MRFPLIMASRSPYRGSVVCRPLHICASRNVRTGCAARTVGQAEIFPYQKDSRGTPLFEVQSSRSGGTCGTWFAAIMRHPVWSREAPIDIRPDVDPARKRTWPLVEPARDQWRLLTFGRSLKLSSCYPFPAFAHS